jgi:AcrR family transcriptional regulator
VQPNELPKQSFTGLARREQITLAAIDVLATKGYAATSMSAIADQIGVSKGILSYHFANKAELLHAVVRFVLDDAAAWMNPRIAGATSYRQALNRYITANVTYLDTHRTEILALTEVLANARATPGIPELFSASQSEAVHALESLFTDGQRAGEFGDVPADILALSLRATIDASSASLRSDPEFSLTRFELELVQLFERATSHRLAPGHNTGQDISQDPGHDPGLDTKPDKRGAQERAAEKDTRR